MKAILFAALISLSALASAHPVPGANIDTLEDTMTAFAYQVDADRPETAHLKQWATESLNYEYHNADDSVRIKGHANFKAPIVYRDVLVKARPGQSTTIQCEHGHLLITADTDLNGTLITCKLD